MKYSSLERVQTAPSCPAPIRPTLKTKAAFGVIMETEKGALIFMANQLNNNFINGEWVASASKEASATPIIK